MDRGLAAGVLTIILGVGGSAAASTGAGEPDTPECAPARELSTGDSWPAAAVAKVALLSARQPLAVAFTETRQMPARRTPVQVEGTLRLDRHGGLSLHYPGGREELVVVADEQGLAWRAGRRPFRPLPAGRADLPVDLLRAVLAGDLTTQRGSWEEDAEAGTWQLVLVAPEGGGEGSWTQARLSGRGEELNRMEMQLARGVVVVIELGIPGYLTAFSAAEQASYFRRGTVP